MSKRIISALLVIVMVAAMLPMMATKADAAAYDSAEVLAVAQEYADKGSTRWRSLCLAFVAHCFNKAYGYMSTACCAQTYGNSHIDSTSKTNIPLGADVFFSGSSEVCSNCGRHCGHVGIYCGDGNIIHSWGGKIRVSSIDFVVSCGYTYRGYGWHDDVPLADGYFAKCDTTATYCSVQAEADTSAMSLPCAAEVCEDSTVMELVSAGDTYTASALVLNDQGEYWYRVQTASGEDGYVDSDVVAYVASDISDMSISDVSSPSAHTKGKTFRIKGDILAENHELTGVSVWIYSGTDTTAEPVTGHSVSASGNTYSLYKSAIDDNTRFGALDVGTYTYVISVEYTESVLEGGAIVQTAETAVLYECVFSVVKSGTSTATVTFDANGGYCQLHRATVTAGSTVALPTAQREGFTFEGWYTRPEGGTEIGETDTFSTSVTLYARWKELEPTQMTGIEMQTLPDKTVYNLGDTLDVTGALLLVHYSNGAAISTSITEGMCTYDLSKPGQQTVIVEYGGFTASFTVTVREAAAYAPAPGGALGDVNGDGCVDSDDAAMILKADVGLLDEAYVSVGDVNGDGCVDSDDAALILKYDVGLISGF